MLGGVVEAHEVAGSMLVCGKRLNGFRERALEENGLAGELAQDLNVVGGGISRIDGYPGTTRPQDAKRGDE